MKVPLSGKRILCKKLPRIISFAAHKLPKAAAFSHESLNLFSAKKFIWKICFKLEGYKIIAKLSFQVNLMLTEYYLFS